MELNLRFFAVTMGLLATSVVTIGGCAAPTSDAPEDVGESQDHLLSGRRLSQQEATTLMRNAGFPTSALGKMLCTIKYESSFYERATNRNHNGTTDYGLFQINSVHFGDAGCPSSSSGLFDAAANTRCALSVYKSQGSNAWYGYQKHRSECDHYPVPADTSSSTNSNATSSSDGAGGCFSGTLDDMVEAHACVRSQFDDLEYQCSEGKWYRGGDSGTGPFGACASSQ